jgi:outer membrane protein
MIRSACLRAACLTPVALLFFSGTVASAQQSEPASPPKQADPSSSGKPNPLQVAAAPKSKDKPKPAGKQPAPAPPSSEMTPAQQQYGLPRNPIIGPPPDTDLSKPLTLERAVRIGLARQNSIAIAQTDIISADARLTQARSSFFPSVTPSYQFQINQVPIKRSNIFGQRVSNGVASAETVSDGIVARQIIFDSGRREMNVNLSRRNTFAAQYGFGNQRQNVVLNVTQDYYNLLRDKELVRVQEESVKRAETTRDVIKAQVEAGSAAQSDILQAEADLANARVALLQAQNDYNLAQASLKNAMGLVTPQPIVLPNTEVPVPDTKPDPIGLEKYVQQSYLNRLDIKQQHERVYAQGYAVRLAQINNGVTVDASVTEGYAGDPISGEERTFQVSVSYPLFDAGNTRAAVRESKAALESERRSLDQLEQNVRLNVEQSYLTREQARQRILATQLAVQAAQLGYDVALEKQKQQLVNIPEVINAEVQLINAQVAQVQAIYDFYLADAALQRDIGINDPVFVPKVPGAKPPVPVRP